MDKEWYELWEKSPGVYSGPAPSKDELMGLPDGSRVVFMKSRYAGRGRPEYVYAFIPPEGKVKKDPRGERLCGAIDEYERAFPRVLTDVDGCSWPLAEAFERLKAIVRKMFSKDGE